MAAPCSKRHLLLNVYWRQEYSCFTIMQLPLKCRRFGEIVVAEQKARWTTMRSHLQHCEIVCIVYYLLPGIDSSVVHSLYSSSYWLVLKTTWNDFNKMPESTLETWNCNFLKRKGRLVWQRKFTIKSFIKLTNCIRTSPSVHNSHYVNVRTVTMANQEISFAAVRN